MATRGLKSTKIMLLPINQFSIRNAVSIRHYSSKLAGKNDRRNPKSEEVTESAAADEGRWMPPSYWLPHPQSGIYFPKGQDRLMEDIPNDAASVHQILWLRSADEGVDHKAHTDDFTFHN